MIKMFVILSYFMSLDLQLNLSTTATLGIEESGRCSEVETRGNVWTVYQTGEG